LFENFNISTNNLISLESYQGKFFRNKQIYKKISNMFWVAPNPKVAKKKNLYQFTNAKLLE